jgi:hypothetical protein
MPRILARSATGRNRADFVIWITVRLAHGCKDRLSSTDRVDWPLARGHNDGSSGGFIAPRGGRGAAGCDRPAAVLRARHPRHGAHPDLPPLSGRPIPLADGRLCRPHCGHQRTAGVTGGALVPAPVPDKRAADRPAAAGAARGFAGRELAGRGPPGSRPVGRRHCPAVSCHPARHPARGDSARNRPGWLSAPNRLALCLSTSRWGWRWWRSMRNWFFASSAIRR